MYNKKQEVWNDVNVCWYYSYSVGNGCLPGLRTCSILSTRFSDDSPSFEILQLKVDNQVVRGK